MLSAADKALYHLSAVTMGNLLTGLAATAAQLWEQLGYSRDDGIQAVVAMMRSVVHNIERAGIPAVAGPYVRGDVGTIRCHLETLRTRAPAVLPPISRAGAGRTALWRRKAGALACTKARPLANCSGRRQPVRAALLGRCPRNMSHWEVGVMTEIPLHWQTISELSRRIHNGSLSPVALMEHLLHRVETLDGCLHSFRLLSRERAMAAAQAAELALRAGQGLGPLHGIPYAVKDLIDVQELPTTAGSNLLLDHIASTDATVVRRLTQAGMVLLGKANTVQFAFGAPGVDHHQGTPPNPWHATPHVPGVQQWLWGGSWGRLGAGGTGDGYRWVCAYSRRAVWHCGLKNHGRSGEPRWGLPLSWTFGDRLKTDPEACCQVDTFFKASYRCSATTKQHDNRHLTLLDGIERAVQSVNLQLGSLRQSRHLIPSGH